MALDNEQKKQILLGLIDAAESDLFRQEAELAALNAEAGAIKDDQQQTFTQQNIDNTSVGIQRIRARQAAWQQLLESL
jgi:hypothetical protein